MSEIVTRSHTASRVILATPRAIFRAFVDPEVMVKWRAPAGMTARLSVFDARIGGGYRMTLTYRASGAGKTDAKRDVVSVRFLELLPDEEITEAIDFESDHPEFAGTMTLCTTLRAITDGTRATFTASNVPLGISEEDHVLGMESTLKNLANLLE
jgi:uncharacterized protein YndB with AHSA1/START domain